MSFACKICDKIQQQWKIWHWCELVEWTNLSKVWAVWLFQMWNAFLHKLLLRFNAQLTLSNVQVIHIVKNLLNYTWTIGHFRGMIAVRCSLDYHTYKVHGVQTEKETLHKHIHAVPEGKKTYEKVADHMKYIAV